MHTSRWYVRNYVRIVCQGGDHSKNVKIFTYQLAIEPINKT